MVTRKSHKEFMDDFEKQLNKMMEEYPIFTSIMGNLLLKKTLDLQIYPQIRKMTIEKEGLAQVVHFEKVVSNLCSLGWTEVTPVKDNSKTEEA